ncbi:ATP-binding protein, partial [Thermodesulfobacteriota bacterium]
LQGICDKLIENQGYFNAWIALLDRSGKLIQIFESGLGNKLQPMMELLQTGKLPGCGRKALSQPELVLTEDPFSFCEKCPLSKNYAGRGAITVRLEHGGIIYGFLALSIPRHLVSDKEEQDLIKEVAGDIAFSLYRIETEENLKQTEEILRRKERDLFQIVQGISIPAFVIDNKHTIIHWNRACENLTGLSSNEMIGTKRQWSAFYSKERPIMADLIIDKATEKQIAEYYKDKYQKSSVIQGAYEAEDFFPDLGQGGKWLFFTSAPLRDVEDRIVGAIETLQDTSRQRAVQENLQKSQEELVERIKELNCLFGLSNLIERQSLSLDEILQGAVDIIPPAMQFPEFICAQIVLNGKKYGTSNFRETIWKQSCEIFVHGEAHGILMVCYLKKMPETDEDLFLKEEKELLNAISERLGRVIERRQAETKLIESEKRFRDLVENSLIGIFIIQDDRIVYSNPEQQRLLKPLHDSFAPPEFKGIHHEDIKKFKKMYSDLISRKIRTLEMDFRFLPMGKSDSDHDTKWIYCRAIVIKYREKDSILFNIMDLTMAKKLEHLLIVQDKMASLGRVAAGIAHEIRNPLSGINIYLNTLSKIYDEERSLEKVKQILRQLQSASNKIESVIRRVMDFSKPTAPRFALIDITKPIEEAIDLSSVSMRKTGIKMEKNLNENLPSCHADPNLIEEVILNLLNNASDAMRTKEGEKKIRVTSAAKGGHILVTVSDSGPGVALHLRDKIFDPFYTTKNDSTGIGLSLCHRIVSDHGGALGVFDNELGGAEFRIEIPINQKRDIRK